MCIYSLLIFLIFHHLRKSLLSQVLCYLFLSPLLLFLFSFFFFFLIQLISLWALFFFQLYFRGFNEVEKKPKITLQTLLRRRIFKYSNFLFIFFILLFYYIFCYLSHKKTKRAKTREK